MVRRLPPPARVLVVGYGASGITSVEQLQHQGFEVTCYEARSQPGGVWNYEAAPEALELSFDSQGRPVMQSLSERIKGRSSALSSAMYDCLHTNVPNPLMAYRGHPFPTKQELYPTRARIASYLTDVAKARESCVHYNTLVTRARHNPNCSGRRWVVDFRNLDNAQNGSDTFDFIVAASGHFNIPYVPYYDGLWLWKCGVSHARSYRSPKAFQAKNVLVVGAKASGYDITRDIAEHLYETEGKIRKVYQSVREPANMFSKVEGPAATIVHQVTAIDRFTEDTIVLKDGTVLEDVDHVLFTTGYLFSYPYFNEADEPFKSYPLYQTPNAVTPTPARQQLHGDTTSPPPGGLAMHNLDALNIFYYPDPTLAFPALQYQVVPMQLAQTQARYIAHKWVKGGLNLVPGPDALAESGWAEDEEVRRVNISLTDEEQFDYEDALMKEIGEGGLSTVGNGDLHEDGSFADNPKWRRHLRLTGNVLKRATLGY